MLLKLNVPYRRYTRFEPERQVTGDSKAWALRGAPAAERLYGYSEAEAVGRSIKMIVPADRADEFDSMLRQVISGQHVRRMETKRKRKDGQPIEVALTVSPIRDAGGHIVGASTIARDISEQRQIEEERTRLIQDLQAALAEVKTLSGLLPICAKCKRIRDDGGYWNQIESYVQQHSDVMFTHGICPECYRKLYPEFAAELAMPDDQPTSPSSELPQSTEK